MSVLSEKLMEGGMDWSEIMSAPYIDTRIYGGYFINDGEGLKYQEYLKEGEILSLKSEPENTMDYWAIAVYGEALRLGKKVPVKLGYIPSFLARKILDVTIFSVIVSDEQLENKGRKIRLFNRGVIVKKQVEDKKVDNDKEETIIEDEIKTLLI